MASCPMIARLCRLLQWQGVVRVRVLEQDNTITNDSSSNGFVRSLNAMSLDLP